MRCVMVYLVCVRAGWLVCVVCVVHNESASAAIGRWYLVALVAAVRVCERIP